MTARATLTDLPARDDHGNLTIVVETPKGSRNKLSYDEKSGAFRLKAVQPLGSTFPFDFGFIPSTLGEDGDPLDVLLLMDEAASPGTLVAAREIGVVEAEQEDPERHKPVRNDRLLAVALPSLQYEEVKNIADLRPRLVEEIEQFFVSYNTLKGIRFRPIGRGGPDRARKLVESGAKALREKRR
jgi:inorganic pyrophosphatase